MVGDNGSSKLDEAYFDIGDDASFDEADDEEQEDESRRSRGGRLDLKPEELFFVFFRVFLNVFEVLSFRHLRWYTQSRLL